MDKAISTLRKFMRVVTAIIFFCSGLVSLQSQISPIGDWDVVISGEQKGVAQITFNSDFTITGFEIITTRPSQSTDDNPRGPGVDDDNPRGSSDSTSTNGTSVVHYFGTAPLTGTWTFADSAGAVVGILTESGSDETNGISFRGRIRESRITLVGHHSGRKIQYRGIPLIGAPDISGNYILSGKKNGEPYVEIVNLSPDTVINSYILTGEGPAYAGVGRALLSNQGKLGLFEIQSIGTNGVLSAISGGFNAQKGKGSLSGRDEVNDQVKARIVKQGL
jgi:hypothetical protein